MNLEAVILGFVVVVDASYLFSIDLIFDFSAFFIDLFLNSVNSFNFLVCKISGYGFKLPRTVSRSPLITALQLNALLRAHLHKETFRVSVSAPYSGSPPCWSCTSAQPNTLHLIFCQ